MTPRCAGARWRILVHERYPRRQSDGTLYGTAHSIASTPDLAGSEGEHKTVHVFAGTEFDEVVVGSFLHAEQTDASGWWVNVGGITLDVVAGRDGRPRKVVVHGPEGDVPGCEYVLDWGGE